MASIFGGFSGFGNMMGTLKIVGYLAVALLISAVVVMLMIWILSKAHEKRIIEINVETKRIRMMNGRERKTPDGANQLYVPKLKKWLPKLQAKDIFLKNKQDYIFLLKDNNGLHHTLRIPTMEELLDFYLTKHNINLAEEKTKLDPEGEIKEHKTDYNRRLLDRIRERFKHKPGIRENLSLLETVYLMPNPSEDIDWLATKCLAADKKFTGAWWQNPTLVWLSTLGIMVIFTIMWFIVVKKM